MPTREETRGRREGLGFTRWRVKAKAPADSASCPKEERSDLLGSELEPESWRENGTKRLRGTRVHRVVPLLR